MKTSVFTSREQNSCIKTLRTSKWGNSADFGATNCWITCKTPKPGKLVKSRSLNSPICYSNCKCICQNYWKGSCNRLIIVFCILALSYFTLYSRSCNKRRKSISSRISISTLQGITVGLLLVGQSWAPLKGLKFPVDSQSTVPDFVDFILPIRYSVSLGV